MVKTKEKRARNKVGGTNYVFYVSEMEEPPASGHFRKMDAGMEIVSHIDTGLNDCKVMKYTEYEGEVLNADSIGIVFPAHMWGISLPVYSFLQHLRFREDAYIYAVAVGESLSGEVDDTVFSRIKILEQFKRVFERKIGGCKSDIFIRSIDMGRKINFADSLAKANVEISKSIKHILEGLLFYNMDRFESSKRCNTQKDTTYKNYSGSMGTASNVSGIDVNRRRNRLNSSITLSNVYLDEDVFAGVKLCRVM